MGEGACSSGKIWVNDRRVKEGGYCRTLVRGGQTSGVVRKPMGGRKAAKIAAIGVGSTAVVLASYLGLKRSGDIGKAVDRSILQAAITFNDSANKVKDLDIEIDKLPLKADLKQKVKKMVGGAKTYAVRVAFEKQGAELISVDEKNNFSTYKAKDGSIASVGSVGTKVITFGSDLKGSAGGFPVFEMGFRVDDQYDRKAGGDRKEALALVRIAKSAYQEHLKNLPDNSVLRARAWKGDDAGAKRQSIYEKEGFRELPIRGDYLWALKNEGTFTPIPDNQSDYIAGLISGRRDSQITLPVPGHRHSAAYCEGFVALVSDVYRK